MIPLYCIEWSTTSDKLFPTPLGPFITMVPEDDLNSLVTSRLEV